MPPFGPLLFQTQLWHVLTTGQLVYLMFVHLAQYAVQESLKVLGLRLFLLGPVDLKTLSELSRTADNLPRVMSKDGIGEHTIVPPVALATTFTSLMTQSSIVRNSFGEL